MTMLSRLSSGIEARARHARALLKDRRGVAAVEFAFIVPVLLCMYFITMEASQGIEVNKKVSRMGSAVADLITQQSAITKAEVVAIMQIGGAIIQPYDRSQPTLDVTAIQLGTEATPVARVAWSLKLNSSGNPVAVVAKNSVVTDSQLNRIRAPGAFYIRVRSSLNYEPVVTWNGDATSMGLLTAFNDIGMGETFYLRPRISQKIPCDDCP